MNKITKNEWEDCYTIYRAMHNGICPQCGYVSNKEDMEDYMGNMACQNSICEFTMSALEIETILLRSKRILKKQLNSFNKVRSILITKNEKDI